MAEKKYIGKPGKQDDPCWKGYEMVGMKKKNGKSVPNCVPEAKEIIEKAKAKAKSRKDPLTGAKIDKDRFILPEETELDEALTRATTGNPGYGYHGNVEAKDDAERDKRYSAMHRYTKQLVAPHLQDAKKPNVMVKHFLDSAHGRHIAHEPTEKNIKSRFVHFAKSYKPEMHEEVQIDEISKQTLTNYKRDMKDAERMGGGDWSQKTKDKNKRGIALADKKLSGKARVNATEEVEIDEANLTGLPKSTAEKNKQYIEITHKLGHKKRVPVHPLNAYKALNRYKKDPSTKSARIVSEELGKDNEWGRPELRKKFAAMTPGQEGMTADKIPTFDPRYDDVTTQHLGLHPMKEGYLAEISARGAEARAKFQARVHKVLNDPASIKRAKKSLAKKAKLEKEKEPPHLVMQLRKAVSVGSKVHFKDGSHHTIAPNHADRFMSKYNSAKSAIEKEALQKRAHASHSEFMKTIAEEVETPQGNGPEHELHMGNGGHIGTIEASHEDMRFGDVDSEELYAELEKEVDNLEWEDIVDLYDPEEIEYEDDESEDEEECGCGEISEAITPAGRLKKKFNAMRTKSRRMMARNIAIKRVSTPDKIKARSVRAARRMVYKRLLRNRDISTVSAAEKTRIEAQIKRMAPMVARLSVRVMPQVRKLEQSRIKNSRMRKKK